MNRESIGEIIKERGSSTLVVIIIVVVIGAVIAGTYFFLSPQAPSLSVENFLETTDSETLDDDLDDALDIELPVVTENILEIVREDSGLSVPDVTTAVDAPPDSLPDELATLIMEGAQLVVIEETDFSNDRSGYRITYDVVATVASAFEDLANGKYLSNFQPVDGVDNPRASILKLESDVYQVNVAVTAENPESTDTVVTIIAEAK